MAEESGLTVARQWVMLKNVPRNPFKVTTAELEAKLRDEGFATSRRTIERDLHLLSAQFPLVLDDRAKPYGWSWAKNANFEFMPKLTSSQAVALLLARTHLRDLLPQAMLKDLVPIFETATQTLSGSGWKDWHKRTAVVPMGIAHIPPRLASQTLFVVQSALAHRHCLTARYRPKGAQQAKATKIHPLGLLSRGPVLYLICTLFDYEDVRQLALHRLSDPVETDERAGEPKGFDFQEYVRTEARRYGSNGPIRLVARFCSPAAEHLRETPLSLDQTLREIDGTQYVEVTATVEDDELLRWWILGFGDSIEVLEPLPLRDMIGSSHAASVALYDSRG